MKADAVRANTTSVQEPFQSFREKRLIDIAQGDKQMSLTGHISSGRPVVQSSNF
jgi:hypothetical protein